MGKKEYDRIRINCDERKIKARQPSGKKVAPAHDKKLRWHARDFYDPYKCLSGRKGH
ncbi:MAG: hypothetical protein ACTSPG_05720 [Candidatus Hodarchaeales archaeon]